MDCRIERETSSSPKIPTRMDKWVAPDSVFFMRIVRSFDLSPPRMTVRDARIEDLPAIVEIYNHAIETSVATFDLKPFTVEERREWFSLFGSEHPLLVCVNDQNAVQGFAYYLPYRPKAGYARTKETTIYVAELYRRTGVATAHRHARSKLRLRRQSRRLRDQRPAARFHECIRW